MRRLLALAILLVPSAAAAEPAVGKMGIVFHLVPHFHKAEWTWTPSIRMKISGPISSSTSISVDYTFPNGSSFAKVKCDNVSAVAETEFLTINDCGFRQEDAVATNQTGLFGFQIKMSDPLSNTNKVLFSGKFTVGKQLYNPDKLPAKNKQFYYYVDQDWRLPFGYVGTWYGDTTNNLYTETWVKGRIKDLSQIRGYLFYKGKQVSETTGSFNLRASPPETPQWEYTLLQLRFPALTDKPAGEYDGWKLWENPGDYEVKIMRDGAIARTLTFTIGPDGKPKDTGALKANGIAKEGALVRVNVLAGDGTWRKDAWKTEAYFHNPITGL